MDDLQRAAVVVSELVGVMKPRERVEKDDVAALLRKRIRREEHARRRLTFDGLVRARSSGGLLHELRCSMLDAMERLAVQVLHREEVDVADGADLVRLHDVRVIESCRDPRLVDEHLDELRLFSQVLPQSLDDGELAETRSRRT